MGDGRVVRRSRSVGSRWPLRPRSRECCSAACAGGRPPRRASSSARRSSCRSTTRTPPARSLRLFAMAEALLERDATGFEIFVLSDTTRPEHLRQRDGGVSRAAREARRPHPRVVPASLGKRRPQGRQLARLRHALGRPLRLHDRARRRQRPRARHARDARARDGSRSEPRPLTDRAAACGRQDVVRAAAAVRGPRVRTRSSRAASRAGRATTATIGGTTRSCASRAFAAAAGLPVLPGKKPFGGAILSHDFVEAALLRRAGWSVRMLPTLGGSWEDSPPSLLDVAARDRRWAQGNIQHLAVFWSQGFTWSEPCPHGHRRHELPRFAAMVCVDRRRLGHCRSHCHRPVRVLHGRDVVVPALAACSTASA